MAVSPINIAMKVGTSKFQRKVSSQSSTQGAYSQGSYDYSPVGSPPVGGVAYRIGAGGTGIPQGLTASDITRAELQGATPQEVRHIGAAIIAQSQSQPDWFGTAKNVSPTQLQKYGFSSQEATAMTTLAPYYNPRTREFDYARAREELGQHQTHYSMWTLGMKAPADVETYEAYGEKGKELFYSTGLRRPMYMSGIDPLTGEISPQWSLSGLTRTYGEGAHKISESTEHIPVVGFVVRAGMMGTLEVEKYWEQHGPMSWLAVPGTIAAGTVASGAGQVVLKGAGWLGGKAVAGFSTRVAAPIAVKYPTAYAIGKGAYGLATLPAKGVGFVGSKVVKPAVFGKYSPVMGKYTPQGWAVRATRDGVMKMALPIESRLAAQGSVGRFGGRVGWWRPPEYFKPKALLSVEQPPEQIAHVSPAKSAKIESPIYGESGLGGQVRIGVEAPKFETTSLKPKFTGGELNLGKTMQYPVLKQPIKILGGDYGESGGAITGVVSAPTEPLITGVGRGVKVATPPATGGGVSTETLEQQLIRLPVQAREKLLAERLGTEMPSPPAPRVIPVVTPITTEMPAISPVEMPAIGPIGITSPDIGIEEAVEAQAQTQPAMQIQPAVMQGTSVEEYVSAQARPAVAPYAKSLIPIVPVVEPIITGETTNRWPEPIPILPLPSISTGLPDVRPEDVAPLRETPLSTWQIEGLEVYAPSLFLKGPKKVGGRFGRRRVRYGAVVPKTGLVNVKAYKQIRQEELVGVRKHVRSFPKGRGITAMKRKWQSAVL